MKISISNLQLLNALIIDPATNEAAIDGWTKCTFNGAISYQLIKLKTQMREAYKVYEDTRLHLMESHKEQNSQAVVLQELWETMIELEIPEITIEMLSTIQIKPIHIERMDWIIKG